jgi:hypothetical protein
MNYNKKEKSNPKVSKKKEIIKIITEINAIENREC